MRPLAPLFDILAHIPARFEEAEYCGVRVAVCFVEYSSDTILLEIFLRVGALRAKYYPYLYVGPVYRFGLASLIDDDVQYTNASGSRRIENVLEVGV